MWFPSTVWHYSTAPPHPCIRHRVRLVLVLNINCKIFTQTLCIQVLEEVREHRYVWIQNIWKLVNFLILMIHGRRMRKVKEDSLKFQKRDSSSLFVVYIFYEIALKGERFFRPWSWKVLFISTGSSSLCQPNITNE